MTYKILVENIDEMPREQWLAARAGKIGGSDIATICGMNPWQSRMQLWMKMTGRVAPDAENFHMTLGKLIEPVIAELARRKLKRPVQRVNQVWQSTDHDWAIASPDYILVNDPEMENAFAVPDHALLECKNTSLGNEWSESEAPSAAMLQLQWQMGIGGFKTGVTAGLVNNREIFTPEFSFDQAVFDKMIDDADQFLRLIKSDTPPEAATKEDEKLMRLKLNGIPVAKKSIDVSHLAPQLDLYKNLQDQKKNIEDQLEGMRARINQEMGDAALGMVNGVKRVNRIIINRKESIVPARTDYQTRVS